jgi:hypothetical protein
VFFASTSFVSVAKCRTFMKSAICRHLRRNNAYCEQSKIVSEEANR